MRMSKKEKKNPAADNLRQDLCNLKPKYPLIRGHWVDLDVDMDTMSMTKVNGTCPLCALALSVEVVSDTELTQNLSSFVFLSRLKRHYSGVQGSVFNTFVRLWDIVDEEPYTIERACKLLDKSIEEPDSE
jgi:hypothetical protein